MRSVLWIGVVVMVVAGLVLVGLTAGWALLQQGIWSTSSHCAFAHWMEPRDDSITGVSQGLPCLRRGQPAGPSDQLNIGEAHDAVERYLASGPWAHLKIAEVMEFERNFYAIAREPDTGLGAMELLVDKETGTVRPEIGPNMMWNARYGMHRGSHMMGKSRGTNLITSAEALAIASRWLDSNRPGTTVEEHAEPFYGYYTIHTVEEGEIAGMLSVHGVTGQVWYHNWHGAFVRMIESEGHD